MTRWVACKPPGQGGSPVTRQVSVGSSDKPPSPAGLTSGRFTPRGISPTLATKFSLDLSMVNLCCKNKHKNKFDRLCSGLNILVSRHLIILKSLSFPSSRKSGSIGQLHNQFADIGFSQKNIVKNNSFDSAPTV